MDFFFDMKTTFREKIVVFWMIFCIFAALKVKKKFWI